MRPPPIYTFSGYAASTWRGNAYAGMLHIESIGFVAGTEKRYNTTMGAAVSSRISVNYGHSFGGRSAAGMGEGSAHGHAPAHAYGEGILVSFLLSYEWRGALSGSGKDRRTEARLSRGVAQVTATPRRRPQRKSVERRRNCVALRPAIRGYRCDSSSAERRTSSCHANAAAKRSLPTRAPDEGMLD